VPGRGEGVATYRRLATRLAVDAYRVRVLPSPVLDPRPTATDDAGRPRSDVGAGAVAQDLATALSAAVAGIADEPVRPLVLVGVDSGAAVLAALLAVREADGTEPGPLAKPWWPDAVVLAGLPAHGARLAATGWEEELDARTHCPVHRVALGDDPTVRPGALADAVPDALLDLAYGSTSGIPTLLLVGDSDPLADRDALTRLAKALPVARLAVVRGAHRDVLNDLQHRSVAAEVVGFLEALRTAPPLVSTITVESSTW